MKICDACGSSKPRHTTPGDPPRRLCHGCHWVSEELGAGRLRAPLYVEVTIGGVTMRPWIMGEPVPVDA